MFTSNQPIALYARLSATLASNRDNVVIQLAEGEEFVTDSGGFVSLRFKDDGISASDYSKKPRPEYELLLQAIQQDNVEVIVATEMTRLYRRLPELLELIKLAESTRLRGIWTTDGVGYDLSTPEGIHAAIAAVNNAMLESAKISKRQKRKQKARAQAGKHHGGVRPYCYEGPNRDQYGNIINRDTLYTALVPEEVSVFKGCVERLIAGERTMWIVQDLNRRGIKAAAGGRWTVGNFQRLMLKPRYVIFDDNDPDGRGTCEYNGQYYRAEWPGIITRAEHALMAAQFKQKSRPWGSTQGSGRHYLLTGLISCGRCGKPMQGGGRVNRQGRFERRYLCKKYGSGGVDTGRCGHTYRIADPVDLLITECVLERFDSPEVIRALAEPSHDNTQIDTLIEDINRLKRHRQTLVLEYGRGEHKKADYEVMLSSADDAIEQAQEQLRKFQSTMAVSLIPTDSPLRSVWADATLDWQRAVISLLVERIVIHPSSKRPKWRDWHFDVESIEIVWRHA